MPDSLLGASGAKLNRQKLRNFILFSDIFQTPSTMPLWYIVCCQQMNKACKSMGNQILNNEVLKLFIYLLIFIIFGCTGSSFLSRLFSSCGKQGLLSSRGARLSHCDGFFCCRARLQVQGLYRCGLVVPSYVGSSQTRDWIYVQSLILTTGPPGFIKCDDCCMGECTECPTEIPCSK